MAKKKVSRTLEITKADSGITVRCSKCRRVFFSAFKEQEFVGEKVRDVQRMFDKHDCHEDVSQAAARIVREATERE